MMRLGTDDDRGLPGSAAFRGAHGAEVYVEVDGGDALDEFGVDGISRADVPLLPVAGTAIAAPMIFSARTVSHRMRGARPARECQGSGAVVCRPFFG